jgi:hypothetical protein
LFEKNGKFFHTPGVWGQTLPSGLSDFTQNVDVRDAARFVPPGANVVGDWHTHTDLIDQQRCSGNVPISNFHGFSPGDERAIFNDQKTYTGTGYEIFVASFDGYLESYKYGNNAPTKGALSTHATVSPYILQGPSWPIRVY